MPIIVSNTVFALGRTGLKEPVLGGLLAEKSLQRRLFTAARSTKHGLWQSNWHSFSLQAYRAIRRYGVLRMTGL
jgi:hypothetical protein